MTIKIAITKKVTAGSTCACTDKKRRIKTYTILICCFSQVDIHDLDRILFMRTKFFSMQNFSLHRKYNFLVYAIKLVIGITKSKSN